MTRLLTLSDAVATHARLQPAKQGTHDSRRSLSYREWDERASRFASSLLDSGLVAGDRVALLAYNGIEWMELYVALARAGLVAVPINFRLTAPEVAYIVRHAQAAALVAGPEFCDLVDGIRGECAFAMGRCIVIGKERPGWRAYEDAMAHGDSHRRFGHVSPESMCALMYTSGTTGKPKGAMRSHAGGSVMALATALEMGFTREDKALLVMPLCHANSLYFATTFIHLGGTIVIDDRRSFDPEALVATLAEDRITFTSLVPTHYIMVLALPGEVKRKYDVASVGKLMISSAPARRDTKLGILDYFRNSKLYELYGSTEHGWVTLLRPEEQLAKLGSVGREWSGSGAIRILDAEGNEVPDGEVGELHSRTPYVFDGYWQNAEKTAEAFRGDWCSVGDMARRDEDGYI